MLDSEIVTESAIVCRFLADTHPSPLLPTSLESPQAPLFRARVNFFCDTYDSKIAPYVYQLMRAGSEEEKESKAKEWVGVWAKEIEPLLKGADPFFGGSKELTLAEVRVFLCFLTLLCFVSGCGGC